MVAKAFLYKPKRHLHAHLLVLWDHSALLLPVQCPSITQEPLLNACINLLLQAGQDPSLPGADSLVLKRLASYISERGASKLRQSKLNLISLWKKIT